MTISNKHDGLTAREHEAQHLLQVYGQLGIEPESGQGVYLKAGKRKIIDFYGGHAVAALGYGHPDMLVALKAQAESIIFQSNAVAMSVRARAAERLAGFAPAGLNKVFFTNSGAEANENALRIACKLTGRTSVTAIEHGFHGRTAAAGAVTWGAAGKWYGFPNKPFDVEFIKRNVIEDVARKITSDTAAVIVELVQGLAGAVDLDEAFVTALAQACSEAGAVLIVDEVQTGIGRCGKPFASDVYDISPDIISAAKSIAGGFPCGAIITTDEIAADIGPGDLGSTFGGGPLACALVETVIDVIERDNLMQNVRVLSSYLASHCPLGPIKKIQGKGFLLGLQCNQPASSIRDALLAQDILVGTSADPSVIRLLPPLILEEEHMDRLIECLGSIESR